MSISIPNAPLRRVAADKASPQGPGAGVLQTEFPLSAATGFGSKSPQAKMKRAWQLGIQVPWIALAEDAIAERFAGVDWHLEDENDEEVTDSTPNTVAREALALIEKPAANLDVGAPFYRADLWALTSRVMGLCGSAFIYLDATDPVAGIASAMLPIAPWRMFPDEDANGNLTGWHIDKTQTDPGVEVKLGQILHYQLRRSFEGHFGIGLIENAILKLGNSTGLDQHLSLILSAGGRMSGIISPKTGVVGDDSYLQMERDWRTVTEQSDAAKRLQLIRAPVDFQKVTLTPQELQIRDLMNASRDDLLTLWGVPLSQVGGAVAAGLNSGDTRKYDEATIWQGPVHHRLGIFREITQYQYLDRYAQLGTTLELELEEPEFDDDSPRYDLLGKSLNTPMTNEERRALIGLGPLGDPALDQAIILPATIVPYSMAPAEPIETPTSVTLGRQPEQESSGSNEEATAAAGESKARTDPLRTSLIKLRDNIQKRVTPRLRASVADVLSEQRAEIIAKLRRHSDAITANPRKTGIWYDEAKWRKRMDLALHGHLAGVAETVSDHIGSTLPPRKANAVDHVLKRGAARITRIDETTRDAIRDLILAGVEEGLTAKQVADLIESNGTVGTLGAGVAFDEYRAELIARTELMQAYNASAIASYEDAGLSQVEAIDGDGDPECAERDGQTFSTDEAYDIEDHPNGTLDWIPVFEEPAAKAALETQNAVVSAVDRMAQYNAQMMVAFRDAHLGALDRVTSTIHELAQTPHNVNVAAPVVNVAPPPAPVVNVPEPVVVVQPQPPRTRHVTKNRDGGYTVTES